MNAPWWSILAGALAIAAVTTALALLLNTLLGIPDIDRGLWWFTGVACAVLFAVHAIHLLIWDECCARNLRFTHWQGQRNTYLVIASALALHLVAVPLTALLLVVGARHVGPPPEPPTPLEQQQ